MNLEIAAHLHPDRACIGTNQDPLRAARIAKLFAPQIRKVFASSSIGFPKREEGFYRFIELEPNLTLNQLCLIDDTAENIEAARICGWKVHHFVGAAALKKFLSENGL